MLKEVTLECLSYLFKSHKIAFHYLSFKIHFEWKSKSVSKMNIEEERFELYLVNSYTSIYSITTAAA